MTPSASFVSQPWLGTVLGVVGLVAAVFFFLRSRRVTRLAYQVDSYTLLGVDSSILPSALEIRFSGQSVPRITASRVVVWNAGNTTVVGSDVVESDPLRLELDGEGSILQASIACATRKANDLRLDAGEKGSSVLVLPFDFLDPEDGAHLRVLHSGGRNALRLTGTIRGMRSGPVYYGRTEVVPVSSRALPWPIRVGRSRFTVYVLLAFGVAMMALGLLSPVLYDASPTWFKRLNDVPSSWTQPESPVWFFVILGAVYAALPVSILWLRRRRYPASLTDTGEDGGAGEPDEPVEQGVRADSE